MSKKPCDNCGGEGRIEGERFCSKCRRTIVQKIHERYDGVIEVRTLSRPGTEEIGRKIHRQQPWDNTLEANEREQP